MIKKKANTSFILVITFISIIGFFIIFSNMVKTTTSVANEAQEFACKSLISVKDTKIGKVADFFYNINYKCHKDKIIVKSTDKKEIFKEIADESVRCWKRYGEGKKDFLANYDTQGNWCFVCGEIEFKNNEDVYKYNNFINYLKSENFSSKKKEKKKYFEIFNIKYTDSSSDELFNIKNDLNELLSEKDSSIKQTALILGEQYLYLQNLRSKEIDTSDKLFVVYKFDRVDSNFEERLSQAGTGALYGTGAAILIGGIAENALWWGGSVLACGLTPFSLGVLAPLCGATVATTLAETTIDSAKGVKKLTKVYEVSKRLTKAIKISKKTKKFIKLTDLEVVAGDLKGMTKLANKLRKMKNIKLANEVEEISKGMTKLGIKSIDEINVGLLKNIENRKNLQNIVDKAIDSKLFNSNVLRRTAKQEKIYSKKIKEFEKLQEKVSKYNLDDSLKKNQIDDIKNLMRGFFVLSSAGAGAVVGYNLDFNSNQYVDIMDKEQYSRQCGTQKYEK